MPVTVKTKKDYLEEDLWYQRKGLGVPYRAFPCCEVASGAWADDKCWMCGEGDCYDFLDLDTTSQVRRLLRYKL